MRRILLFFKLIYIRGIQKVLYLIIVLSSISSVSNGKRPTLPRFSPFSYGIKYENYSYSLISPVCAFKQFLNNYQTNPIIVNIHLYLKISTKYGQLAPALHHARFQLCWLRTFTIWPSPTVLLSGDINLLSLDKQSAVPRRAMDRQTCFGWLKTKDKK